MILYTNAAGGCPVPSVHRMPATDMFKLPRDLQHEEEEGDHGSMALLIPTLMPISSIVVVLLQEPIMPIHCIHSIDHCPSRNPFAARD